jgi:hypothetical protein
VQLRAGHPDEAAEQVRQALRVRPAGSPPFEELLLALAWHERGNDQEARHWLDRADAWLGQGQTPLRAGSLAAAGADGPLALLAALPAEAPAPRLARLPWADRLELRLLRREARTKLPAR